MTVHAKDESTRQRAMNVNAEALAIGPYLIDLDVCLFADGDVSWVLYEMPVAEAVTLRDRLTLAIEALTDRVIDDSIAGDCDVCSNTRMSEYVAPGGRVSPHGANCPVCTPKIAAVRGKMKTPSAKGG